MKKALIAQFNSSSFRLPALFVATLVLLAIAGRSVAQDFSDRQWIIDFPDSVATEWQDPIDSKIAGSVSYLIQFEDAILFPSFHSNRDFFKNRDYFASLANRSNGVKEDTSDKSERHLIALGIEGCKEYIDRANLLEIDRADAPRNIDSSFPMIGLGGDDHVTGWDVANMLQLMAVALEKEGYNTKAMNIYSLIYSKSPKVFEWTVLRMLYAQGALDFGKFAGFFDLHYRTDITVERIDNVHKKVEEAKALLKERDDWEKSMLSGSAEGIKETPEKFVFTLGYGAPVVSPQDVGQYDREAAEVYLFRNWCARMACPMLSYARPSAVSYDPNSASNRDVVQMAHTAYQVFLKRMEELYEIETNSLRNSSTAGKEETIRDMEEVMTILRKLGELPF